MEETGMIMLETLKAALEAQRFAFSSEEAYQAYQKGFEEGYAAGQESLSEKK